MDQQRNKLLHQPNGSLRNRWQSHDESTRTRYGINHEYQANNAIFDKLFWQLNYQTSETVNNNTSYVEIVDPFNRFGGNYIGDRSRLRQAKDDNVQLDVQFATAHTFT